MSLAFFGLTPEAAPLVRQNLFNQIHEIVFHGQGGYSWNDVYQMPTWLRKFTFHKIKEYYDKKNNKEQEDATQSWLQGDARKEAAKNAQMKKPTYSTNMKKASK